MSSLPLLGRLAYNETFTVTGNGSTFDLSKDPLQSFGIQVIGTGGTPTLWDVRLEGSLDGVNFTQIMQHSNLSLSIATTLFTGTAKYPCTFIRTRVVSLTLGPATNIKCFVVGLH